MTETRTVFLACLADDSAQATRALRAAGFRVVDPREFKITVEEVAGVIGDCDLVVAGPGFEDFGRWYPTENIEALVPAWRSA